MVVKKISTLALYRDEVAMGQRSSPRPSMSSRTLRMAIGGSSTQYHAELDLPRSTFGHTKVTLHNPLDVLIVNPKPQVAIMPGDDGGKLLAFNILPFLHPLDGIKGISIKPGTQGVRKPVPQYT